MRADPGRFTGPHPVLGRRLGDVVSAIVDGHRVLGVDSCCVDHVGLEFDERVRVRLRIPGHATDRVELGGVEQVANEFGEQLRLHRRPADTQPDRSFYGVTVGEIDEGEGASDVDQLARPNLTTVAAHQFGEPAQPGDHDRSATNSAFAGSTSLPPLDDGEKGRIDRGLVELFGGQQQQRLGPVDPLGHARWLLQAQCAQPTQGIDHPCPQFGGDPRHRRFDDLSFPLGGGVVDTDAQTSSPDGISEFTGLVRRDEDPRNSGTSHSTKFGDGDLALVERLEQQRIERIVGSIQFVDEQDDRFSGTQGLKQGPLEQELLAEERLGGNRLAGSARRPASSWAARS